MAICQMYSAVLEQDDHFISPVCPFETILQYIRLKLYLWEVVTNSLVKKCPQNSSWSYLALTLSKNTTVGMEFWTTEHCLFALIFLISTIFLCQKVLLYLSLLSRSLFSLTSGLAGRAAARVSAHPASLISRWEKTGFFHWSSSLNWFSQGPRDLCFQMELERGESIQLMGWGQGEQDFPFWQPPAARPDYV